MKNLVQRTFVALVFIPLFLALVHWGGVPGFVLLVLPIALLAQYEFYKMFLGEGSLARIRAALLSAALLMAGFWGVSEGRLSGEGLLTLLAIGSLGLLAFCAVYADGEDLTGHFPLIATGILYIPFSLGFYVLIRGLPGGSGLILYLVGLTWIVDIFAYAFGSAMGRVPLAPVLSPKKTWEGAVGGVAGALLWTYATHRFWVPAVPLGHLVAAAFVLSVTGQVGDLAESSFKRTAGVKDSGSLIPGHGGFLDKVDSLLFNGAVFYAFLVFFEGYSIRFWV